MPADQFLWYWTSNKKFNNKKKNSITLKSYLLQCGWYLNKTNTIYWIKILILCFYTRVLHTWIFSRDCTHLRSDHFDSHIYRNLSLSGITISLQGIDESWNLYLGYHFIPIKCFGSLDIRKRGALLFSIHVVLSCVPFCLRSILK